MFSKEIACIVLNIIIWLAVYLIATLFLIRELKSGWQLMRIDNGLSDKSKIVAPEKADKNSYTGLSHEKSYKKIYKLGIILSILWKSEK